jgi:hypothetical protein
LKREDLVAVNNRDGLRGGGLACEEEEGANDDQASMEIHALIIN